MAGAGWLGLGAMIVSAFTFGSDLAWPGVALGHQLNEKYQAPLPLVVYVGGAALAVAMSFVFVILRNAPAPRTERFPLRL